MTSPVSHTKWYYQPYVWVIVFLCVGPFALPFVWFNPTMSRKRKTGLSIFIIVISCILILLTVHYSKSANAYYQLLNQPK